MEHLLRELRTRIKAPTTELARRSGLSRSTIFRIETGAVDPGIGTLRELVLAAGYDLDLGLTDLSDVDAARAARAILDQVYEEAPTREVSEWIERLGRWVPDGGPVGIVRAAGEASSLLRRASTHALAGSADELKLAAAGESSGAAWLLSGAPVLNRIRGDEVPTIERPAVLYTADPPRVLRLLENMTTTRASEADVIVTEYSSDLEFGSWSVGPIRMVAPIQALIDAFGLGSAAAEVAERTARQW